MNFYQDTSFLCALYREQDNSDKADAFRQQMDEPLYVTKLLEFEFRQSIRLQVWLHQQDKHKGYAESEAEDMLEKWSVDLVTGALQIVPADADAVLRMAEHLSQTHTMVTGNRTLDILHVATAKHLSAREFLSFDTRQQKLARLPG